MRSTNKKRAPNTKKGILGAPENNMISLYGWAKIK